MSSRTRTIWSLWCDDANFRAEVRIPKPQSLQFSHFPSGFTGQRDAGSVRLLPSLTAVRSSSKHWEQHLQSGEKKPFINEKQRGARLKFAQNIRSWTPEDWTKVIFSDESHFQL